MIHLVVRHPRSRIAPALLVLAGIATATTIQGTVLDARKAPLANVAVWVMDTAAWPRQRALTNAKGEFKLELPGSTGVRVPKAREGLRLENKGGLSLEVRSLEGALVRRRELNAEAGTWKLVNPQSLLSGLPTGTWLVSGQVGATRWSELIANFGPVAGSPSLVRVGEPAIAARGASQSNSHLLVRRAGFESFQMDVPESDTSLVLSLETGRFETRIDSVMASMDLADKLGQMTQGLHTRSGAAVAKNRLGSLLSGGGDPIAVYDDLQNLTTSTPRRIPLLYGIDAVHGHAKREGGTVLPHNIALGATGDTLLLRRLGELTAKEMWAGQADWAFAPCIAVARDERWGRTYESYGEVPELAARLGAAYVRGLQGDAVSTPWRVVACAKHYLADGGTSYGTGSPYQKTSPRILNEGDAQISQAELDSIHLPGYIASVAAGVGTVMASYSSFNGDKMHGNKALLTDTLKTDLAFDGFVVSDWLAIEQLPGAYGQQVAAAINAGTDMGMEPNKDTSFIATLADLVQSGAVPQSRIDDAVRRILRVKFRQGLFESSARRTDWDSEIGSAGHRALAREAVRKSLVVLKNDNSVLPLPKSGAITAVVGTHADNTGRQCGGWTKVGGQDGVAWNGSAGIVQGATSILAGMKAVGGNANVQTSSTGAKTVVVVTGEEPYAETRGDREVLALPAEAATLLRVAKKAGQKTVLVLISGRPLILGAVATDADAIVAAWLPGSEGQGVAEVLYGDYAPTGKLPCSWPADDSQVPVNFGDGKTPLYRLGHGLSW